MPTPAIAGAINCSISAPLRRRKAKRRVQPSSTATPRAASGALGGQTDDLDELIGAETRSPDQRAVDFGLRDERTEIVRGDTSAVLHLQALGHSRTGDLPHGAADQPDGRVGAFGGRGATGPDGPDRLVRDHYRRELIDPVERGPDLARDHLLRL